MFRFVSFLKFFGWSFLLLCCGVVFVIASFYLYLTPTLPNTEQLKTIQLQTPLRIYTQDKKRIAEFGEKRRTPINIDDVPENFINAFIAAEDDRFFEHFGIDPKGLARAASQLIASGRIQSGGSTITMQVAKNFFLSSEKTFIRKFNEIFLALQIERNLSKNEILELYLNKIYLGNRAYGIQAAAQVYYGKPMNQLNLAQMAMIAGLPKAPSSYNPLANPQRAKIRRNWILNRMLELGMIEQREHNLAFNAPITARYHDEISEVYAPYVAEMARQEIIDRFGTDAYTSGMRVYVTVDSKLQDAANKAVVSGLESYDRRHGYRGPLAQLNNEQLNDRTTVSDLLSRLKISQYHQAAAITDLSDTSAKLLFRDGSDGILSFEHSDWAAPFISINRIGSKPLSLKDVVKAGSVIEVEKISPDHSIYKLTQTPEAQAALVSISPKNGAIQALIGGYDFSLSHYNRATQAKRQPGSNFKPFIYLTALEQGMTASTLINDAPIVFDDNNLEASWRPENSSGNFYGPTRIREALFNSRNLVSIRLLQEVGVGTALETAKRFGFDQQDLPRDLSLALGNAAITALDLAQGYSRLANGGFEVDTFLIDHIEDYEGNIIFQAKPKTVCQICKPIIDLTDETETENIIPDLPIAERIADERSVYILHSMLKDVISYGTAQKARSLNRNDLAGKTGTTNDQKDAWFSGFNTQLQTTVWVGFDKPSTLGRNEYGASAALPIWMDFVEVALKGKPSANMMQPEGIVTARIDKETGRIALPGAPNSMFEIYKQENAPEEESGEIHSTTIYKEGETISPEDIF